MSGKIVVRDGETVEAALKRLRRQVGAERAFNKWPVWAGYHATESQRQRRKRWLRAMKAKWDRIREELQYK